MTEFPHLRMRLCLENFFGYAIWPEGVHLCDFAESHAAKAHRLLELAYANGGGAVPPFEEWWNLLSQDGEYDPNLCFPVCDTSGSIIAFAQCWTTAFVKDFVVHPHHRRQGVGRALLLHIFRTFQDRGAEAVDLKVNIENPTGAVSFYESLGMHRVAD